MMVETRESQILRVRDQGIHPELKDPENPAGYQINIDTIGALWFGQLLGTWIGIGFVCVVY